MKICVLKSKIHRARVTNANIDYIGSIAIDKELMNASEIVENEKVLVVNITNGKRWETYAISAKYGSKIISPNGGGARLCVVGDILVIMAFTWVNLSKNLVPKIILLNKKNEVINK